MVIDNVKVTERGWAGHLIIAKYCLFRRNTLLEYNDKKWIVSTVGNYRNPLTKRTEEIGLCRWYETMAFEGVESNGHIDADVSHKIPFETESGIFGDTLEEIRDKYPYVDNVINEMHDNVVAELIEKIKL